MLTDRFYVQNFLPKFESILSVENEFLRDISSCGGGTAAEDSERAIEISSYNPLPLEMNILPVISKLLENSEFKLNHSLPITGEHGTPLVFREYKWGDDLVKSRLFSVYEPSEDKRQVYPQVLIVPLIGFMDDCHRIGYGGGFYDRTIEQIRDIYNGKMLMIGVAFEA